MCEDTGELRRGIRSAKRLCHDTKDELALFLTRLLVADIRAAPRSSPVVWNSEVMVPSFIMQETVRHETVIGEETRTPSTETSSGGAAKAAKAIYTRKVIKTVEDLRKSNHPQLKRLEGILLT